MSLSRAIRRAGIVAGLAVQVVGGTALPANAADFVFPSCPGFRPRTHTADQSREPRPGRSSGSRGGG